MAFWIASRSLSSGGGIFRPMPIDMRPRDMIDMQSCGCRVRTNIRISFTPPRWRQSWKPHIGDEQVNPPPANAACPRPEPRYDIKGAPRRGMRGLPSYLRRGIGGIGLVWSSTSSQRRDVISLPRGSNGRRIRRSVPSSSRPPPKPSFPRRFKRVCAILTTRSEISAPGFPAGRARRGRLTRAVTSSAPPR